MPRPSPKYEKAGMDVLGKVWAIGFSFGMSVIAGGVLGWGVDYFAKTKPWGLLAGLGLGLVAGMVRFVKEAKQAGADSIRIRDESEPPAGAGRPGA